MKIVSVLATLLFATILFGIEPIKAQSDEGMIYGKVTTIDNNTYQGAIRWGKEEVFWFDYFNSTKLSNENLKYLSRGDKDILDRGSNRGRSGSFWFFNVDVYNYNNDYNHTFVCQFGEIKSIEILRRERVRLVLKNDNIVNLEGGSNDIGAKVNIYDEELGKIALNWSRVEKVEFFTTPEKLEYSFGKPIYGTVISTEGEFTGYIQWDNDERLTTGRLDGDNRDGDYSIEFGKIRSIEKTGRGCDVTLKSGREIYLTGSNDVNSGNRGVIVNVPDFGRMEIEWDEFDKVVFDDDVKYFGVAYDEFPEPLPLAGTVTTIDDESISGMIVFDLDEAFDYEILQGEYNGIEFSIPFRNIKKIIPKNYNYSKVELRNGQKLLLGDSHDVTDRNQGALIFIDNENQVYVPWENIEEINFR